MTFEEYREYLKTPHWDSVRRMMLWLQPFCQQCEFPYELNVHHKTYERLGDERVPEDLVVLCASCHMRHHFIEDLEESEQLRALVKEYFGATVYEIRFRILSHVQNAREKNRERAYEIAKLKRQSE